MPLHYWLTKTTCFEESILAGSRPKALGQLTRVSYNKYWQRYGLIRNNFEQDFCCFLGQSSMPPWKSGMGRKMDEQNLQLTFMLVNGAKTQYMTSVSSSVRMKCLEKLQQSDKRDLPLLQVYGSYCLKEASKIRTSVFWSYFDTPAAIRIFATSNHQSLIVNAEEDYREITEAAAETAVREAVDVGYRHFDCAHFYQNEKAVGRALQSALQNGKIQRESIFVTSKLWHTHHRPELVVGACRLSLQDLQLDYLDLYLVHGPVSLMAMEELVSLGLVKSIGISNFTQSQIDRIYRCARIQPVVLQIESHLGFLNQDLINHATAMSLHVTAYAPLGAPGTRSAMDNLFDLPVVKEMSAKYGKTPAQILLRHCIQRGLSVIPKTVTAARMRENLEAKFVSFEEHRIVRVGYTKSFQKLFLKTGRHLLRTQLKKPVFDFHLLPEEMSKMSAASPNIRRFVGAPDCRYNRPKSINVEELDTLESSITNSCQ
ncbi:alcohol dehydrogenase [NADP+] A [Clonorchis sinensis]|uniref:Alcohol dehydrogenase [NADP+] A n=1 Tax=Clonorchis sinensis TaxID=79923 RepID=G7YBQ5_CLOSI|nr:alcohol dehydrogenase [NADP+] A [Clonorchis sinensis]